MVIIGGGQYGGARHYTLKQEASKRNAQINIERAQLNLANQQRNLERTRTCRVKAAKLDPIDALRYE